MPRKLFGQSSFFSPEFAAPGCLPEGSVGWALRRHSRLVFPEWLFGLWRGNGRRGRKAWPASVLLTALILKSREGGMSRLAMVRRLRHDVAWRAAAGLQIGGETPDEATFRRFERHLRQRDPTTGTQRLLLWHEHVVRLCIEHDVVGGDSSWVIDSTPMWCFGATRGTLRMLGDGLRSLCGEWARLTGKSLSEIAEQWSIPMLLAKSTKGAFLIDWRNPEARADVTDRLVRAVLDAVQQVRASLLDVRRNKRKGLLRRCRQLCRVVASDLEVDEAGRFVIAHRVAAGRLVSITDPDATGGRKTKNRPFKGFKVHLLGDASSGLILSVCVTAANVGDISVAHRLLRRAKDLCEEVTEVLGDTAYGGAALHLSAHHLLGIDVVAPPVAVTYPADRFGAPDFDVDTANGRVTCPAGRTVDIRHGKKTRYAFWAKATCSTCPLKSKCLSERGSQKSLQINKHHDELIVLRERWEQPETQRKYRARTQGERLIGEVVRRGCRQARAFGLQHANQQALIAAIGANLALLSSALAHAAAAA